MNLVKGKWDEIIQKLKKEYDISDVSFETWITPLEIYDVVDSTVRILVPLKACVDYLTLRYLLPFQECIARTTGKEFEVKFITSDEVSQIGNDIKDNSKKKDECVRIELELEKFQKVILSINVLL